MPNTARAGPTGKPHQLPLTPRNLYWRRNGSLPAAIRSVHWKLVRGNVDQLFNLDVNAFENAKSKVVNNDETTLLLNSFQSWEDEMQQPSW